MLLIFMGLLLAYNRPKTEEVQDVTIDYIVIDTVSPLESKGVVCDELLGLESDYTEMLLPIMLLKKSEPKIYWFIVSWLNTAYGTPRWKGYYSEKWKEQTKRKGIDCSGFARVMLDQVFDKKVAGSSQGILNHYCHSIKLASLKLGDLVFFRAPYSSSNNIVHVGIYLMDDYFVHATSTKSAAKGLGLSVNSLKEENWKNEFISGGQIKN